MVEVEFLVVAGEAADREIETDDTDFLGAGKQPRIGAAAAARRDCLGVLEVIGLVGPGVTERP